MEADLKDMDAHSEATKKKLIDHMTSMECRLEEIKDMLTWKRRHLLELNISTPTSDANSPTLIVLKSIGLK